jgi:membrane protein
MAKSAFIGISRSGIQGRTWKTFFRDLKNEISEDNVPNGAAALAYYLLLAIFPAMIFLLGLLPYLPIPNLQQSIMDMLGQALPGDAAKMFTGTVQEIVSQKRGGLLSLGALLTLWASSAGMSAIMQQLNITYDVKEGRPFYKSKGIAILLTLGMGALVISAFGLIILGGSIQGWMASSLGLGQPVIVAFAALRWVIIAASLMLAFALTYYFAPDVEQEFRFISPGSVLGVVLLVVASLGFKLYVENFGSYAKSYGSIGAVIVMMLWLNIMGLVILLGSEVNALIEHYSPQGKAKGQKDQPEQPTELPPHASVHELPPRHRQIYK